MAFLTDVLLANNPGTDMSQGWSARSGRTYDVNTIDYLEEGSWSIAANYSKIGPGTVGWIRRPSEPWHQGTKAARWGFVAGVVVFTDTPAIGQLDGDDPNGRPIHYCTGVMWRFPREWWIDGARINLAGWSGRTAPFGSDVPPQFASGRRVDPADAAILRALAHPIAKEWIEYTVAWHCNEVSE